MLGSSLDLIRSLHLDPARRRDKCVRRLKVHFVWNEEKKNLLGLIIVVLVILLFFDLLNLGLLGRSHLLLIILNLEECVDHGRASSGLSFARWGLLGRSGSSLARSFGSR